VLDTLEVHHFLPIPGGFLHLVEHPAAARPTRAHRFRDRDLAKMAQIARTLDAEAYSPTYSASTTTKFTSASTLQTAIGVASSATDFGLAMLAVKIGYDASAAGTGITLRFGSCTFATNGPGTNSTSVTPIQTSGRTIAATNITAGVNWTAEPTVKTYLGGGLIIQPFGGAYDSEFGSDREIDTFNSGAMGFFVEHTPAAAVGTAAEIVFCRI